MFTVLLALVFSLAVCVGVVVGFNRIVEYVQMHLQERRERSTTSS